VSIFEALRDQVPVDRILETNSGDKARCVSQEHEDAHPSMHIYPDHAHCFSCGFRGDVTDVWAAMRGFDRPIDAALDLAREHGVELPQADPGLQKKAQERREKESRYLKQARACHRALDSYPRVGEWWDGRGFGEDLRERFFLGTNRDGTSAVIPFWHRGRVKGLIRRKLRGEPKYIYPTLEDFPEGHRPLFIPGPVRAGAFLVEGILDALAIAALGESAIAVGGTGISNEQMRGLRNAPGPLYVLPDADEEGAKAAREWVRELYPKALLCPAEYGGETNGA
jgi:DNA primase